MSGKRKLQVVISFGALLLSARLLLAAQVSSQSPAVTISSPSPIGDTTALAKEAQGWLIDLIRTNTTNPPGNEQATAKYLAHILEKEGIQSEQLDLAPGRSALVARLRSSAMAGPLESVIAGRPHGCGGCRPLQVERRSIRSNDKGWLFVRPRIHR